MKFIPHAIQRRVAEAELLARKNSPTILLGAGVVSMVGSTVLACRATLKVEEVINEVEANRRKTRLAKTEVEEKDRAMQHNATAAADDQQELRVPPDLTYDDHELRRDMAIIYTQGAAKIVKLYAPSILLGGVGVVCLTKSHSILKQRNAALAAAYVALEKAFDAYRERVVDRYGEETDREFRYGAEQITIIDDETGKMVETVRVEPGEPSAYARWFDYESSSSWNEPEFMYYNWKFLRDQQNWANDMLRSRGHVFLNEVYSQIGLSHTSAGAAVGWVWDWSREHEGDNYIDFGCWDEMGHGDDFFVGLGPNGREGSILLDFNVDGPIWNLIDQRNSAKKEEARREQES